MAKHNSRTDVKVWVSLLIGSFVLPNPIDGKLVPQSNLELFRKSSPKYIPILKLLSLNDLLYNVL